jgi:hypothetical protein
MIEEFLDAFRQTVRILMFPAKLVSDLHSRITNDLLYLANVRLGRLSHLGNTVRHQKAGEAGNCQ